MRKGPRRISLRAQSRLRQASTGSPHEDRSIRRLSERLVRHAVEQLLSRPDGLQMQQLGGEMWREDRKIDHMADDDDSCNREEGRA